MRRLAFVASLALLVSSAAAATARVPASAAVAALAGTTTVSFSGNVALRLLTSRTVLREGDVDLRMTSGSYAFVRAVQPADPSCDPSVGPRCFTFQFDWVRGYTTEFDAPAHRQHETTVSDPPVIEGPTLDIYIVSDGKGEVTLRTPLPGTRSLRAVGRFAAARTVVPVDCAGPCRGPEAQLRYGGRRYDLGQGGWAQMLVLSYQPRATGNGLSGTEACLSPNPATPTGSAEPASWPYGCGHPPYEQPREYVDSVAGLTGLATALQPTFANGSSVFWTAGRGPQYMGGRAVTAGLAARDVRMFAIAFRYGIS